MSGFDRAQTPKTRPMPPRRSALVAALDIGTSKIACLIARLKPCPPSDALRGRTHAVELIGHSQIQSRGVKAGAVVDLADLTRRILALCAAPAAYMEMSRSAARLCDGLGVRRIVQAIVPEHDRDGRPVRLRPARRWPMRPVCSNSFR